MLRLAPKLHHVKNPTLWLPCFLADGDGTIPYVRELSVIKNLHGFDGFNLYGKHT